MHKLVIYRSEANLDFAENLTNPIEVKISSWADDDKHELYGRDWARWIQDDIVMWVEDE